MGRPPGNALRLVIHLMDKVQAGRIRRPTCRGREVSAVTAVTWARFWSSLFRLFGRIRGPRDPPGVVLLLGLRNAFERGLVGLVIDLRLLFGLLGVLAVRPLAG